jgi:hypothetical protein
MDNLYTLDLALFLFGTFAAALVTGLVGFAFGIVAAAIWLHVLSPLQATVFIVAFGLIVQGVSVWKLRQAIKWDRLLPFLIRRRHRRPDWWRIAALDNTGRPPCGCRRNSGAI